MTHQSQIIDFHSAADTTAAAHPAQEVALQAARDRLKELKAAYQQAQLDYAVLAVDAFQVRTKRLRGRA